ncbi:Alanine--tRNA ligase [Dissostichus eleginoides]|uniref:Alanine--tRNA ligase n=1 Tax=Dissostichus eleginoides TaxID=100907 RepID=A0AAD9F3X7_DISEL|nr:Alanine--tRNA ligase [Dissostichus eleginoides]
MGNARREMGGEGPGVSEFFSAFGCGMRLEESVRQAEEKRSWLDEHGKAFTKSELPTPRTLRAFRGLPRDATTPAAASD